MGGIGKELSGAEEEMRQVVLERVAAVHAKDPAPLGARQAPDIITFDVLPPLHSRGSGAVEDKTRAWFGAYASEIGYEVHDLHVTADGDIGFCSFLYHVTGTWPPAERSTCGCAPPSVAAESTGAGASSMTTSPCPSTRRPVRR